MGTPLLARAPPQPRTYNRRRPEATALYEVVRDNLETLYSAVDDGALGIRIPRHARKELDAYLDCGLVCRGFARLRCGSCTESLTVAFSCKGRGFCPSCMGRRMSDTAAHLVDDVLPEVGLRQWVLTSPFAWRARLAHDGGLLSGLTRLFVDTVSAAYRARIGEGAKTGAVTVVQRTSSDLRLNPHLHVVFLDGAYRERDGDLVWRELPRLTTTDVASVLEAALRRIDRHLRRRGALAGGGALAGADQDDGADQEASLALSAVSGRTPPAGPEWQRGLPKLVGKSLSHDKHLCASMDGFTLHAATRAGAADEQGREALLRYVLRPAIAQERVEQRPDGLVRITLKRAFGDGTVAVDMDPLSLVARLAAAVPPPRFHTVKYAGVLASAHRWRARIAPRKAAAPRDTAPEPERDEKPKRRGARRLWAELLARTFAIDVLQCPKCSGRMKLVAMVTDPKSVRAYLRGIGEPYEVPERSPSRGPPYW
ncbi:MAG: transposase, partial [Polyangiaceae bacterium]|nr:transposase [Polyangiaceae bacterium]